MEYGKRKKDGKKIKYNEEGREKEIDKKGGIEGRNTKKINQCVKCMRVSID